MPAGESAPGAEPGSGAGSESSVTDRDRDRDRDGDRDGDRDPDPRSRTAPASSSPDIGDRTTEFDLPLVERLRQRASKAGRTDAPPATPGALDATTPLVANPPPPPVPGPPAPASDPAPEAASPPAPPLDAPSAPTRDSPAAPSRASEAPFAGAGVASPMDPVAVEEFELIREAPADHAGVRIPLCGLGDRLVVGRSSTADVLLLSARAAREHARLRRHGDGWTLEAVSGHGVRVNARIVEGPERLVPGSRIELGDDVLLFERPTDAVEPGDAPARGPWIALVLGVAVLVGLAVAIWSRG